MERFSAGIESRTKMSSLGNIAKFQHEGEGVLALLLFANKANMLLTTSFES